MTKTLKLKIANLDLQPLISKASKGVYQKFLGEKYGVGVCKDQITDEEIEDLLEDIELLKYIACHNTCTCDREKLIETLT